MSTLLSDLRALGLAEGDHVLVHSSYKALGPAAPSPAEVVETLRRAVGPTGTVLFPAHAWMLFMDRPLGPETPRVVFSLRETPAMGMGIIAETARLHPEARRSLHATHSVMGIGALADWLTADHHRAVSQVGLGSPYQKLAMVGGKILLLGVDHERNTSLHGAEEASLIPGVLDEPTPVRLIDAFGHAVEGFTRPHSSRWRRLMNVEPLLVHQSAQQQGTVLQAPCRLIDAAAQFRITTLALLQNPDLLWAPDED